MKPSGEPSSVLVVQRGGSMLMAEDTSLRRVAHAVKAVEIAGGTAAAVVGTAEDIADFRARREVLVTCASGPELRVLHIPTFISTECPLGQLYVVDQTWIDANRKGADEQAQA